MRLVSGDVPSHVSACDAGRQATACGRPTPSPSFVSLVRFVVSNVWKCSASLGAPHRYGTLKNALVARRVVREAGASAPTSLRLVNT